MDQKIRTTGGYFTSALLAFCAFIFITLGIGMVASYPDEIWWVGVLLLLCAILVGYSSVSSYRSSKKEKQISDEQMQTIKQKIKPVETSDIIKLEVLATWAYSQTEWKAFMKWEKGERISA